MGKCCISAESLLLDKLLRRQEEIINSLNSIVDAVSNLPGSEDAVDDLRRMQAHINPMTVAAEYPTVEDGKFVVSTATVRFLDMLNSDMYVVFKIDNNDYDLPVYFKDSIGYEHRVVLPDATPVIANQLLLNGIYAAKYQYTGGYIILDSLTPLNPNVIT